ncbi:MAG: T9SS type A sorting domain-containing protein [bacterium]
MERFLNIIIIACIAAFPGIVNGEIKAVSAGAAHSLVLMEDGSVYSWGANSDGQLGTGDTFESHVPVRVRDITGSGYLGEIVDISAGNGFSLALAEDSTVYAWGANDYGQLGNGTILPSSLPVQVVDSSGTSSLSRIVAISGGSYGCLALDVSGGIWSWGSNREGALGRGDSDLDPHPIPGRVLFSAGAPLLEVADIACGSMFSFALREDSSLWAWGSNADGQLGNDTTLSSYYSRPVLDSAGIDSLGSIVEISATGTGVFGIFGHALAIDSDGKAWSWGRNFNGQLGDGATSSRDLPVRVRNSADTGFLMDIAHISAGSEHSLALLEDGSVWGWGNNYYGVIGDNSTSDKHLPVRVHGIDNIGWLTDIVSVATSNSHNLALDIDGELCAWGRNNHGQLGDGTTFQRNYPVAVLPIPIGVEEIPAKPGSLCATVGPNPFNSAVLIRCNENSDIEIFDLTGRKVDSASGMEFLWSPSSEIPSGLYLIRVSARDETFSARAVYLK